MTLALILRHWKVGVMALLLLAVGAQTLRLAASERSADKWRGQAVKANVLIEMQNDAVAKLEADGKTLRAGVDRARKEGLAGIERADRLADELERERPLSGTCSTPEQVMRAGL